MWVVSTYPTVRVPFSGNENGKESVKWKYSRLQVSVALGCTGYPWTAYTGFPLHGDGA